MKILDGNKVLRRLTTEDYGAFADHFLAHSAESGQDQPLFLPAEGALDFSEPERRERLLAQWAFPIGKPNWIAHWGLFEGPKMVAHLDLTGPPLKVQQHRVSVGIGVRMSHRRQGIGLLLMETAIAFTREQGLAWLDLHVLEGNEPAIALYRRLGFVETGRVEDAFRIYGRPVGNILMSLKL